MAAFFAMFHLITSKTIKLWALISASLIFYGSWDARYVLILLFTALFDFFIARKISETSEERKKRFFLVLSLSLNLGALAYFKYLGYFLSLFEIGFKTILPLGISFYTFQSMAYVIDVYRGRIWARKYPRDFLAAVSFFPHLLAGPLIRVQTLFPQFENVPKIDGDKIRNGFYLVAIGLFKKTLADLLGVLSDQTFANVGELTTMKAWSGALAFVGQMYGDFSGYTDIAIGLALLLGFELPKNFYLPFLATSPADYYTNRWHISLATWIKEYLYTPLALMISRKNSKFLWLAPLATMFLMGLWHGANITFIVWGLYVGALIIGSYFLGERIPLPKLLKIILTQYFVMVGLIIFRANHLEEAWKIITQLHTEFTYAPHEWFYFFMSLLGIFACFIASLMSDLLPHKIQNKSWVLWLLSFVFFTLSFSFGGGRENFIYFQF